MISSYIFILSLVRKAENPPIASGKAIEITNVSTVRFVAFLIKIIPFVCIIFMRKKEFYAKKYVFPEREDVYLSKQYNSVFSASFAHVVGPD